jgi:fatty acid desaturase
VPHDLPSLPWYLLPRIYQARRNAYNARSGGFHVQGYGGLMRRHAFRPVDAPVHPHMPETEQEHAYDVESRTADV